MKFKNIDEVFAWEQSNGRTWIDPDLARARKARQKFWHHQWYVRNRPRLLAEAKIWREQNKNFIKEYNKFYYRVHRHDLIQKSKAYYRQHRRRILRREKRRRLRQRLERYNDRQAKV